MSLLSFNLSNLPKAELLEKNEYRLVVDASDLKPGKKDPNRQIWNLRLSSPNHPNADAIFHMIALPVEGDSEKGRRLMLTKLAACVQALGLDPDTFDTEEAKGREVFASVDIEDYEGVARNVIKSFTRSA